jgi:cytochrome c oxidase cbb3-type subunit IV
MTYNTIATISQVISLLMFIAMFAVVLLYALWPTNQHKFDLIQRRSLDLDCDREADTDMPRGTP